MLQSPNLKADHLTKFQIETLFYMFYAMPKDILQAFASQELYRRDWRYHGELKIWLKSRNSQELMQSHPTVQFVYFDVANWEPRLFTVAFRGNIISGLLTEEEVRVKALPQQQQTAGPGIGSTPGPGLGN
jgi:CCR4-NOT transcription complex subunit 2